MFPESVCKFVSEAYQKQESEMGRGSNVKDIRQAVESYGSREEKGVASRRLSSEMQRRSSTEHRRRSERGSVEKIHVDITLKEGQNLAADHFPDGHTLSEVELHSIKSSFEVIEFLWRDIAMGSDHILMSVLSSIHENLGEIGSELFRKHFISRFATTVTSTQVTTTIAFQVDS